MARVTLNPILKSISGRIGSVVFYAYNNRQYMRSYVVPCNPDTAEQRVNRARFAEAVLLWQVLPGYKKSQWNGRALLLRMSGYNLFISCCLKDRTIPAALPSASLVASPSLQLHSHSVSASPSVLFGSLRPISEPFPEICGGFS